MLKSFSALRTCYSHMGGIYAVNFFSILIEKKYIKYIDNNNSFINSYHKLPLLITKDGIKFFEGFNIKIKENECAYACLDGTEKKPHLAGICGNEILTYFFNKKVVFKNKNSRILTFNHESELILMKNLNCGYS